MISFELSSEQKQWQKVARDFAEKEIRPFHGTWTRDVMRPVTGRSWRECPKKVSWQWVCQKSMEEAGLTF